MQRGPRGRLFNKLLASCVFLPAHRLTFRIHKGEATHYILNHGETNVANDQYHG